MESSDIDEMLGHVFGILLLCCFTVGIRHTMKSCTKAFDMCHMYTHSVWYALMLFSDEALCFFQPFSDHLSQVVSLCSGLTYAKVVRSSHFKSHGGHLELGWHY